MHSSGPRCTLFGWCVGMLFVLPVFCGNEYSRHSYVRYSQSASSGSSVTQLRSLPLLRNYRQSTSRRSSISHDSLTYTSLTNYSKGAKTANHQQLHNAFRTQLPQHLPQNYDRASHVLRPQYRLVHNHDGSSGNPILTGFQETFKSQRIQRSHQSALAFLHYFIPYTAAIIMIGGLILYFSIGIPAWLRAWVRKEYQGLFGVGRNHAGSNGVQFRMDTFGHESSANFGLISQVRLAMEGSWLWKLQERIERDYGKNSGIYANCCILPKAGPLGMADCQIFKQGTSRKRGFDCPTRLTYKLEFGPSQSHRKYTKKSKKKLIY